MRQQSCIPDRSWARSPRLPCCLLTVVAAVGVSSAGCLRQGGPSPADPWVPFESKEGNFKALFPQRPTHKTTKDGREHRYTVEYRGGRRVLRVSYEHDYDTGVAIAERFKQVGKLPG